jgi:hypothetical protein
MAVLLGVAMKGDPEAELAIFTALRSSRVQHEVLTAAAEIVLAAADNELLSALLVLHKEAETERNFFAHGIWGQVGSDDRSALWCHARDYALFNVEVLRKEPHTTGTEHRELEKKMYVYTIADLWAVYDQILQDNKDLFAFTGYLRCRYGAQAVGASADERYRQLCNLPHIARALSQLRSAQRKKP